MIEHLPGATHPRRSPTRRAAPAPPAAERYRVLVVDDYVQSAEALAEHIEGWGYQARAIHSGEQALASLEEFAPDLIVSDLKMPGINGIELMEQVRGRGLDCEFLLLTGQGTIETAVDAIKRGAFDYISKPVDPPRLRHLLERALERLSSRRELFRLRRVLQNEGWFDSMIGDSPRMVELYRQIEQVAPSAASVLITGESGTGKELVARAIHQRSPRAGAGVRRGQLRGHPREPARERAVRPREGRVHRRDRDAAGLLRAGRRRHAVPRRDRRDAARRCRPSCCACWRSGASAASAGRRRWSVDVRVIAATNRDLEQARRDGVLREDLYYRLNVFHLDLPPLRERGEDRLLLAQHFITEFAHREGKPVAGLDNEARVAIMRYDWPGNVRELRNAIERAVIVARGPVLGPETLPPTVRGGATGYEPVLLPGMTVDEAERQLIFLTLERTGGNKTRAAKLLDVSLKTLHNKLRRYRELGLLPGGVAGAAAADADEVPAVRDQPRAEGAA